METRSESVSYQFEKPKSSVSAPVIFTIPIHIISSYSEFNEILRGKFNGTLRGNSKIK